MADVRVAEVSEADVGVADIAVADIPAAYVAKPEVEDLGVVDEAGDRSTDIPPPERLAGIESPSVLALTRPETVLPKLNPPEISSPKFWTPEIPELQR